MAIRPLPGEVLEHLPRGIDESQISHHVPLRGGPDGLLGETHLLLFHGELVVLTRGGSKTAFRRLDLDPDGRAMLLAESWSVQLSLPTQGAATCFEVSSREVATVLALISAVKPGPYTDTDATDAEAEIPVEIALDDHPATATTEPVQHAVQTTAHSSAPVQANASRNQVQAPAHPSHEPATSKPRAPNHQVQASAQRSRVQTATIPSAPHNPAQAVAASRSHVQKNHPASALHSSASVQTTAHPKPVQDGKPAPSQQQPTTDEVTAQDLAPAPTAFDDDLTIDIDIEHDLESRPSALASAASSVRDIAASFRGAAASLRSAASSLRRSHDDEPSLTIDIDDVFSDFSDDDSDSASVTDAQEAQEAPQHVAPARVVEAIAIAPASSPRSAAARPGLRFNFDDLPVSATAAETSPHEAFSPTEAETNVSLAEFFDRHVPPSHEVIPSRRRRMVQPAQSAEQPATARPATARPQTPVAPQRIPVSPLVSTPTPVAPPAAVVSMPTPVAPPIPVVQAPTPTPVAPTPAVVTAESRPAPISEQPPDDRHLVNPRWAKGARRSATAAASAATTAASATATAASAAVGRARVAANRLLDRQRSRSGRPRMNRRRLGSGGSRPTVTIAAALMTVALLIYWVLPSGEFAAIETGSATPNSGMSAEIASEIRERQASALPAAIGLPALPEESSDADSIAKAEAEAVAKAAAITDRNFYDVATLTPESPQPELLALKECRPLAERGLLVRVKVEIDEPTGTVPEVWVGDSSMDRELRQCISRQFRKATFVPKIRGGKLIKPRLKLNF